MRVSAAGWLSETLEETRHMAKLTADVTHNHSGNNSLSILPLDDGVVIKEVLFYDQNKDNQNEEFLA